MSQTKQDVIYLNSLCQGVQNNSVTIVWVDYDSPINNDYVIV